MLPLGLIVGAIALELVDVSGASAALQAEIRDQAQRAIAAETRQEVPATACSEADCGERVRLWVIAGVTRMSWTAERWKGGQRLGRHELSGNLQSSAALAVELARALFPTADRAPAPTELVATAPPGAGQGSTWPKVVLAGAGGAALAVGIGLAVSSLGAFDAARAKRRYEPAVQDLLDRGYAERTGAVVVLSAAGACAVGLGLSLLFD